MSEHDIKTPDFNTLEEYLARLIGGAIQHHTYVDAATQKELSKIYAALNDARKTTWVHLDDALPPLNKWVRVGGFHNKKIEDETGIRYERHDWASYGERKPGNGGSWSWEFDDEDFDGKGAEYWAYEFEMPDPRHFKLKDPKPINPDKTP